MMTESIFLFFYFGAKIPLTHYVQPNYSEHSQLQFTQKKLGHKTYIHKNALAGATMGAYLHGLMLNEFLITVHYAF